MLGGQPDVRNWRQWPVTRRPLSCGPFRVVESAGTRLQLTRNPMWPRPPSHVDSVQVLSFREHDAGALWIPNAEDGIVASLTVNVVAGDGAPLTLEAVEDLERAIAQETGTARTVERVELPAGAAVRARGPEPDPRGSGPTGLVETVAHTVVPGDLTDPDGLPAGVRMVMGWSDREHGDALADMADDLAALLGIERDPTV